MSQEQLKAKDDVLSHVSHELRTPLTAAHQFVAILLDGIAGDLKEEQREYLEIVLRNLKQLQAMIGDLLDTARARGGKLAVDAYPLEVLGIVNDLFRILRGPAAEKGITLDLVQFEVPVVWADATRVCQILTNLIENAIKFADGGAIIVSASADQSNIAVIILSARDPEVNRPKALALGAAAYLQKPCEPGELLSELRKLIPANPTPAPQAEKSAKVLVVDDDADTKRGMGIRLRASGFEPIFANDGLSAISAAVRERPDLILLDLGLPAGDGLTVLERLAKSHALCSIPVVVISGRSAEVAQEKALALGAKAYLQKPVANELLLETVSGILSGRISSAS